MSRFHKLVLGGSLLLGMLIPQTLSANFYVIPVGQSPIPTSAVKSIMSSCVDKGAIDTVYTVPDGKAFVLKEFRTLSCNSSSSAATSEITIGSSYQQSNTHEEKFDLGVVIPAGETITIRNISTQSVPAPKVRLFISGYETRP